MPDPDADPYRAIEDLLDEIQLKHFDQAERVGEYRRLIEDARENPTPDSIRVARSLPGAKYFVTTEYIRQLWLKLEVELQRSFGDKDQ
jgi:hypothetical protein